MSILLEGDSDSAQLLEIRSRVIALWQQGEAIGQEFLDAYERQYLACQAAREVLSRPRKMRKPKRLAMNPGLLDYDWQTYSARLRGHGDERFDERLNVLQQAQNWFSRGQFFEDFLLEERRAISGVTGGIAKLPGRAGEVDWGIFGSMKGFGVLQSLILTNNHQLSVALDEIPTTGPVHRHQYDAYCDAMLLAFQGQYRVCGVSTVSRFLALKRPDTFVCVDDKNRSRIAKDLNFVASTQTIHSYWDDVIIPIMESRWWNSNRPTGTDGFLWDGRVAMLDSIYYDG